MTAQDFSKKDDASESRRRFLAGVLAITGGAVVANASVVNAQEATPAAEETEQLMFVQVAESGSAELVDGGYLVTLAHDSGQTLFFSDRPERLAGVIDTAGFVEELAAISGDPPNAALTFQPVAGDPAVQLAALELTQPVFDASAGTVTYQARIIDAAAEGGLTSDDSSLLTDALPAIFNQATVFIDGLNQGILVVNLSGRTRRIGIYRVPPRG